MNGARPPFPEIRLAIGMVRWAWGLHLVSRRWRERPVLEPGSRPSSPNLVFTLNQDSRSMSRIAALLPSLVLLTACGSSTTTSARKPTEVARQQAAGQFACQEQDVVVREIGSSRLEATGCGKTATYSCTSGSDDVIGVSDRRCRRVTEIAGQSNGAEASLRAAKTGPKSVEEATPSTVDDGATTTFPREDARTALRAAEGGLHSCTDSAVPQTLDVSVRFETSGNVSSVEVTPPGRAASCVESRLREVAVTPFEGQPVTVRLPMTL